MPEILARAINELHSHGECGRSVRSKHLRKNHYCVMRMTHSVAFFGLFSCSTCSDAPEFYFHFGSTNVFSVDSFLSVITLTASTISLRAVRQKYRECECMCDGTFAVRLACIKSEAKWNSNMLYLFLYIWIHKYAISYFSQHLLFRVVRAFFPFGRPLSRCA